MCIRGARSVLLVSAVSLASVGPALAAEPEGARLDEVVVTAQKRAQNLQDVSLAVSAIGADQLVNSNITSVQDLAAHVPNVAVGNQFGQAQFFIRGIGLDNVFTGADPSVALHVDGAVVSQATAQLGAFFDLERVEVLRGPQGTLYGRNSTGGVINLITAKPTDTFSGYARGTIGNYNLTVAELAVAGPILGNKVLGRVAVRTEDRGGYGVNEVSGTDIDDSHTQAARAHLQFLPTEKLSILLTGEWFHEDDAAYSLKFKEIAFPRSLVPGPTFFPALQPVGLGGYSTDRRNVRSEGPISNERDTWALTSTIDYKLSDVWALKSITNYRYVRINPIQDLDVSSAANPTRQNLYSKADQFSQEVQLQYSSDRLNGLIAAYYFKEDLTGDNRVGLNPGVEVAPALRSLRLNFFGTAEAESYAVLGQATYNLTDQWALTLGGRYTSEERVGDSVFTVLGSATRLHTGGQFENFSPKVTAEYRPTEDIMLFGTYSKGFKAGVILVGQINPIVRPEIAENWEGGIKSQWFDRTLTLNLTAFHTRFTDLQVGRTSPAINTAAFQTIFENAGQATAKGVEMEFAWRTPVEGLHFDATAGYLDAQFDEYTTAYALDAPVALPLPRGGNPLPQSPKWSFNGRAQYDMSLSNDAELSFVGEVDYKSKVYFNAFKDDRISQDARTILNANVRYTAPGGKLFVNVWGKNLTDELVWATINVVNTGRLILGVNTPPRTYGVTVGYSF
jgi:iron complex outermembrane recepter protein